MFALKSVRYLAVGVLNTLVGYLVIVGLKFFAGIGDIAANMAGYGVGISTSYVLNSRWTFEFTGRDTHGVLRYILVLGAAYLTNLATVMAVIRLGDDSGYLAQAIGIVPYTLVGYFGCRLWAFRSEDAETPATNESS